MTAQMDLPAGYEYDSGAQLLTPLSGSPIEPSKVRSAQGKLTVQFDKADLDNNVPEGASVPLTLVANFIHEGVQKQLTSTATPTIVK